MDLKISRIEALAVFLALAISACLAGDKLVDWLAVAATFLSFCCTQVSFDMAEVQSKISDNSKQYTRLYLAKEICWIASCLALGSAPLIVSTVVFGLYPFWRRVRKSLFRYEARAAGLLA